LAGEVDKLEPIDTSGTISPIIKGAVIVNSQGRLDAGSTLHNGANFTLGTGASNHLISLAPKILQGAD
jgi:hypothetical protein